MQRFDRYFGSGPRIHLIMLSLAVIVYYLRIQYVWTSLQLWEGAQLNWASAFLLLWIIIIAWSLYTLGKKIGVALVTDGPYAYVRHPIYTAEIFFGWIIVLFILNSWLALVCMVLTFYLAHHLIAYEETLMRREFGEAWDAYAKETPPLIPKFSKK